MSTNLPTQQSSTEERKSDDHDIQIYPSETPLPTTFNLSIVSYNILYKGWVTNARYPLVNDEFRSWTYRLPVIRNTLSSYKSDIICLQEMDINPQSFQQDFGNYFNKIGYDYLIPQSIQSKQSTSNNPNFDVFGNVILFNKLKYKCIYYESHKKNTRMLIGLFVDLQTISTCKTCANSLNNSRDNNNNVLCTNHSFFIINVHLTGHPQKHMQRLHEMKKLIEKLDIYSKIYKLQKEHMRIIICGDFNSPKTGLCDKLLINGILNYNNIKINNVSKQGRAVSITNNIRRIRFIFNNKDIGLLIGHKGFFINKLKTISNANIIIPTSDRNNHKIHTHLVIIIGYYLQVLKAISMIINRVKRSSLLMCIDEANITCLNFKQIYKTCWGKINISPETLYNSTEKTIDISGNKKAVYTTTKMIVKQLFNSKLYIITRMEYFPQDVNNHNIFIHKYKFKDSYNEGLISYLKSKKQNNIDEYFDRLRYFPTFSDGRIIGAMDFIYYTYNNMELKCISKTVNDKMILNKLKNDIDKSKKEYDNDNNINANDIQMEQGINSNIWYLPNGH
eukprot:330909_1